MEMWVNGAGSNGGNGGVQDATCAGGPQHMLLEELKKP